MKPSRRLFLAAVAAAFWVAAAGFAVARADTLDDRVYAVARQLMCPVCAGQTVAESDSAVARDMRDVIRAKLQAGETPAAILKFFVGQFGEGVLAEPPRRGLSLLLYLGPPAGVVAGLAIAVLCIRWWTVRAGAPSGGPPASGGETPGTVADGADPGGGLRPGPEQPPADWERARLARELEARDRL